MLISILYFIFGGFLIISLYWYFRILVVYKWLKDSQNKFFFNVLNNKKNIYVLIPVLDEVSRIEGTVRYFIDNFGNIKNFNIVLISTEKEFDLFNNKTKLLINKLNIMNDYQEIKEFIFLTTGEIFECQDCDLRILKEGAELIIRKRRNTIDVIREISQNNNRVMFYHYPYNDGNMADQLNYAINDIISSDDSGNEIFCVYNADSRPHPKTFEWVLCMLDKCNIKVFQQYGNYFGNIYNFKGWIGDKILISAALWQTRWSVGFEIFNALKQFKFLNHKESLNYPLNYCIGHGLFFVKDIYKKVEGFNSKFHNEDAIFGLKLSFLGELIMPIPYFDESDTPNSVASLYKQKANWFFGPLQAFNYYKEIMIKQNLTNVESRIKLFILSLKLFSHALYWIVGPSLLAILFVVVIYLNNLYLWFSFIGGLVFFLLIPNMLIWIIADIRREKFRHLLRGAIIGSFPCYILHGMSAYRTLFNILIGKVLNRRIIKEKTIMS